MKKICDCPYTDHCHEPRQWLSNEIRKTSKDKTVEGCLFYHFIKLQEENKPHCNFCNNEGGSIFMGKWHDCICQAKIVDNDGDIGDKQQPK